MKEKLTKKENIMQTIKFTLFSISAGIIQLVSYTILFELIKAPTWIAYIVSLVLSVLWNFTFNKNYTFKSATNVPIAMLKVGCFYLVFAPLSTLWTHFFDNLGVNNYIVEGGTMVVNFVLEFLYCRFFVYKGTINTKVKKEKNELEK